LITVSHIAQAIDGQVEGDPELLISDVCELKNGSEGCISYLTQQGFKDIFADTDSSAVIVDQNIQLPQNGKTLIRVNNPALGFIKTIHLLRPQVKLIGEIHNTAVVTEKLVSGANVTISANTVIEVGVVLGDDVYIGPGSFIGQNVQIGSGTRIEANVSIYHDIYIGNNVHIDSGSVIGADGFGLVSEGGIHHRFPHVGSIEIGNDVLIGANCCIDRGTIGNTIVGEQTKLDNQIQIAHNVQIGKGCIIAGQVGIAGSSVLGNYVTLAGQVGIVGHIEIGDGVVVASKSAVMQSVEAGCFISGIPAQDHGEKRRQDVAIKKLPELLKRVKYLENEIKKFKKD
jgi:UDP-3-O-[3-hydroxymyristoyl] glucosamine N-acyltransferase